VASTVVGFKVDAGDMAFVDGVGNRRVRED
jgi:hypothetical protein